jgi:xanthine dehydrogenase YagR molybdenum-binding subunit
VIGILTHQNTPKFGRITVPLAGKTVVPLQDHRVHYEGQAVALVVADSLERAAEAARLLQGFYSDAPFEADFLAASGGSGAGSLWHSAQPDQGNVAAAWSQADVKVEATYQTADRHHRAIEPARPWLSGRTGSSSCTMRRKG